MSSPTPPPLVAVADDDPVMRRLCEFQLRKSGLAVVSFPAAGALFADWQRLKPVALVLDYELPDLDGVQVLHRLRHIPGSECTPVVCITAHSFGEVGQRLREAGAAAVFTKPFSPAVLAQEVVRLLRQETSSGV